MKRIHTLSLLAFCVAAIAFTGCKSTKSDSASAATKPESSSTVVSDPAPASSPAPAVVATPAPKPALPTIRIAMGAYTPLEDSKGNKWLADQGFADGDTIDRTGLAIEGTEDDAIYQAERYAMSKFSQELPNGNYVVKLHFAETFEGVYGPGERVFSFNVEGTEFKDFDVWAKSGGFARAYVETVPVEIMDGSLDITFATNIENPEINGIEILPAE